MRHGGHFLALENVALNRGIATDRAIAVIAPENANGSIDKGSPIFAAVAAGGVQSPLPAEELLRRLEMTMVQQATALTAA